MLIGIRRLFAVFVVLCSLFACYPLCGARNARLTNGEHTVVLNGVRFHYVVEGQGPLLVVQAPGWGIGSTYLENGLAPLTKQFTLLTFDPRGSGKSSRIDSSQTLTNSDLVDDLEILRQFWGIEAMDLVGHSNGSAIAICYAERYPSRIHKLVLIGSQLLGYEGRESPERVREDERRRKDPQFAYLLAHIDDPVPGTDEEFTQYFKDRAGFYLYFPSKDGPALLRTLTNPLTISVNKAFLENPPPSQAPPVSDLAQIRAETLVIEGRQDPVCPLDESEKIKTGIRKSKLIAIDQSGHFPWIEQPSKFFPAIIQFLKD
jgi:proline iminopeptidase